MTNSRYHSSRSWALPECFVYQIQRPQTKSLSEMQDTTPDAINISLCQNEDSLGLTMPDNPAPYQPPFSAPLPPLPSGSALSCVLTPSPPSFFFSSPQPQS